MVRPQTCLVESSGKSSRQSNLVVIPGGKDILIVIFTQHMSYSYDVFTSVTVGAYTLGEALMEHSGCVRSILRVWKSLEVSLKYSELISETRFTSQRISAIGHACQVRIAAKVNICTTFECHWHFFSLSL